MQCSVIIDLLYAKNIRLQVDFSQPAKEVETIETLKQEVIRVISILPDTANIEDIMYELYVIDKVKKGREAVEHGQTISIEDLKREMQTW